MLILVDRRGVLQGWLHLFSNPDTWFNSIVELSFWITFSLGIVTVLAAVVVPILISRKENPKRELVYDHYVERLLGDHAAGLGLVLSHNEVPLGNPYLVTLIVVSTGRADIGSERFDERRPIRFKVSVPVLVDLDGSDDATEAPLLRFNAERGAYEIHPALINRNARISCRFLVEGKPKIDVVNPLRDIEVKTEGQYYWLMRRRNRFWSYFYAGLTGVVVTACFLVIGHLSAVTGWPFPVEWSTWLFLGGNAGVFSAVFVALIRIMAHDQVSASGLR